MSRCLTTEGSGMLGLTSHNIVVINIFWARHNDPGTNFRITLG